MESCSEPEVTVPCEALEESNLQAMKPEMTIPCKQALQAPLECGCTSNTLGPNAKPCRDSILAKYGGIVEVKHQNSLWRRDLVYERRGLRLEVRPMTPDDDLRETDFFNAQSMKERLMRFMGAKSTLLPEEVRQLTHLDFDRDFAIVAVDRKTDALAGIARFCRDREETEVAEVAVAVLQCYQRLGLARYLLSVLFDAAKEYGIKKLCADILRENTASRRLFEKVAAEAGAKARLVEVDFDVYTYEYTLPALANCKHEEKSAPPSEADDVGEEQVKRTFTVDDSRHPRSLWRHDLVYENGMRIELRPADPDDKKRLRHFAHSVAGADDTSIRDLEHLDFTSGFNLVAIDSANDELVGAAHFHRSKDCSRLSVLTDPGYRGLGISDFLAAEVLRAAEKEIVLPAKRACL